MQTNGKIKIEHPNQGIGRSQLQKEDNNGYGSCMRNTVKEKKSLQKELFKLAPSTLRPIREKNLHCKPKEINVIHSPAKEIKANEFHYLNSIDVFDLCLFTIQL